MLKHLLLISILLPGLGLAQDSMNAREFDEYTRGKTFTYGSNGAPYGAEEYLDNRRVRWSFLDGKCQEGEWYEENGLICFVYQDKPDPQCWKFTRAPSGISALFQNDPTQSVLYEMQQSQEPLMCLGPEIGV
ncbi:MAG: hypothetical protein AAGK67_11955 [Pseudomonadota bacterium]